MHFMRLLMHGALFITAVVSEMQYNIIYRAPSSEQSKQVTRTYANKLQFSAGKQVYKYAALLTK